MLYAILAYHEEGVIQALSEAEDVALVGKMMQVRERLGDSLGPAARLGATALAATIRDGLVIDGPFAETKEQLGGFYGVEYGEDWEMWVRIAAHYDMAYTPEVLAEYRKHYSSISGRSFVTAENMSSLEWVMKEIQNYLPVGSRKSVLESSRAFYAHYAMRVASALWKRFKDRRGALAQALAAWNMSRDAGLLYKIIKLYTRITLNI